METHKINNFDRLATDKYREDALSIVEAGLEAIDTEAIVKSSIKIENNFLYIKDQIFNLNDFNSINVVGFGKASSTAAKALESVLGEKLTEGIVIDKEITECTKIKVFKGSHPRPSHENVEASKFIVDLAEKCDEKDLVIVIVSGGGSALFCWPESECTRGLELYDSFLKSGETINELNKIRKHISMVKGGGLAKILYPATVVGLIFSDIPGEHFEQIASGPTFRDASEVKDAEVIISRLNLGKFDLTETPKEDKYFEKVHNVVLVANTMALQSMADKAKQLGYEPNIMSCENYEDAETTIRNLTSNAKSRAVNLMGGEIRLKIIDRSGSGGRNSFLVLSGLSAIDNGVLISIASDGTDNGPSAGAIADENTLGIVKKESLDLESYISRYDSFDLFKIIGATVETGATGANVSDLILYLKK